MYIYIYIIFTPMFTTAGRPLLPLRLRRRALPRVPRPYIYIYIYIYIYTHTYIFIHILYEDAASPMAVAEALCAEILEEVQERNFATEDIYIYIYTCMCVYIYIYIYIYIYRSIDRGVSLSQGIPIQMKRTCSDSYRDATRQVGTQRYEPEV